MPKKPKKACRVGRPLQWLVMWLLRRHNTALAKRDTPAAVVFYQRQIRKNLDVELGPKHVVFLYFHVFIKYDFVHLITIARNVLSCYPLDDRYMSCPASAGLYKPSASRNR
jgi:hypothetical protein